jgi:hypothetical protein
VACPCCGEETGRVHGYHGRTAADVPVDGRRVLVSVRIRRMRCPVLDCPRQTFREQIPGLLARYQRRTTRLSGQVGAAVRELAGRAGSRLLAALGVNVSRHTALRALMAVRLPGPGVPRVLGIDDFALRKGHVYATILTGAETGRRVDVLEGRTAGVVEDWLKAHPGVEIVCRDGSGAYGEAVKSALPGAVQCGDRWHLWHLLAEAAAKEVAAHSACWAEAAPLQQGKRAETTLERWRQVHGLRSTGAGLLDCSRRLGLSLNTVKRYDRASEPGRLQRVPKYRPTLVDPYRDYLRRRREEEPGAPVQQLLREIRERGYPGSSNLLVRYINQGRLGTERPHIAPRKATQILLTNPENLPGDQRETAGRPSAACPQMKALTTLIGKTAAMLDPVPPTRTGSWNGSPALARRTSRTRTRSPAASSPASRPPPQPSRSRTTTAAPKASKQDENDRYRRGMFAKRAGRPRCRISYQLVLGSSSWRVQALQDDLGGGADADVEHHEGPVKSSRAETMGCASDRLSGGAGDGWDRRRRRW